MNFIPSVNSYNIPVWIAALLDVVLIFLVLFKTSRNRLHRTFVIWTITVAIWNIGALGIFGATNEAAALFWSRVTYCGNTLMPATFLQMVLELCENTSLFNRRLLAAYYIIGSGLLFGNFVSSHFLAAGVLPRFWGYAPVGGPGTYVLDLLILTSFSYSLRLLRQAYHRAWDVRRNQLQYVFWGIVVFFAGGIINVLMVHGVDIYPFGNILNIVFCLAVAYAIISYQWLDIRLALRQSLVYGSLGTALTATYVGVVYFIEKSVFANHLNPDWVPRLLAMPPTIIIAPALKGKIQPWVEQHLFTSWEAPKRALRELGLALCACLDVQKIAEDAVRGVSRALDTQGSALFLWDANSSSFHGRAAAGSMAIMENVGALDLRPSWFQGPYERVVVTRELDWRLRTEPLLPQELATLRDWLIQRHAAMVFPVRFQQRLLGLWLVGNRRSRDMLPPELLNLLASVASQMALALNNAIAIGELEKQRVLLEQTREMAVIGTMATEMAHELTKPLTHIMNAGARLETSVKGLPKENLRTIEREAQRAAEILDGFAMLSPERTLHRIAVSLSSLIEEAEHALGIQDDKRLRIVHQYDKLPSVFVNPGQVVQVLTNVIQNAWEAMPEGGTLTLSLHGVSIEDCLSKVIVTVIDTGHGIAADIQGKVFQPFFTTKGSKGGRGVGLSISRAMIQRHGGDIQLESPIQDGGGTRVTITLPIIQNQETSS